jgi:hypothetical protein
MPPPTRNMAAVPTIVSSFISSGAPARTPGRRSGKRIGAAGERAPPSSSLTIAATKP